MNPTGFNYRFRDLCGKNFVPLVLLAFLGALVTGCPHNEYMVELKPKGEALERTLTFYRADGNNSNGIPNYQEFPSNELATIVRVYPAGAVQQDGQRHVAKGEFSDTMPNDVGGAGTYKQLVTSLGSAGFYLERFRGNDDLAGRTARQMRAADQITDLAIGWAKSEFGHERNWKKFRRFLDEDFRRDLKNAAMYYWTANVCDLSNTNAPEEFTARFCLYLLERGYFQSSDAPELYGMAEGGDVDSIVQQLTRKFAMEKLEISATEQSKSLTVLNDYNALKKSWEKYLAKTDLYRAEVKAWEKKQKTDPKLVEPEPLDVMNDLFDKLLEGVDLDGEADHLVVKLALPHQPDYSNGKWQDGRVVWKADLYPARALPAFCYANWSQPAEVFQKTHLGDVLLSGEELTQYCLWQAGLGEQQAREWESFLAGLQPGNGLLEKIKTYQFAMKPGETNQPDAGRRLLVEAFPKETNPASGESK